MDVGTIVERKQNPNDKFEINSVWIVSGKNEKWMLISVVDGIEKWQKIKE